MSKYYKVTNLSEEPCHMTWNKALLTDEELEQYEAFKLTPEFIGMTDEDISMRKKVAESIKARPFFDALGKDVRIKVWDRVKVSSDSATAMARYEWKFVIGPNVEEIKKPDAFGRPKMNRIRKVCEAFDVPYTLNDDIEVLAGKLSKKFGSNVRVLSERQWKESGLQAREQKEIVITARPGISDRKIVNEGYLTAEEMTETEAYEYLFPSKNDEQPNQPTTKGSTTKKATGE